MLPSRLNSALKEATDERNGVTCDKTALQTAKWIKEKQRPAMLLCSDLDHYLVAYGFGYTYDSPNNEIERNRLYFLVTDNGAEVRTGAYSMYRYKPFWRHYRPYEFYFCVKDL